MTAKDDLRHIRKLRERELRARDRAKVKELRGKVRQIRRERRERMRRIREACRLGRERVRDAVRVLKEQTRQRLAMRVQAMQSAERGTCQTTRASAAADLRKALLEAQGELQTWKAFVDRRYGRKSLPGLVALRKARSERVQESDDEVRRNLEPELIPVFEKVKAKIKAGPRRTRTEAFLEWVHDNQDEAHSIMYAGIEEQTERYLREQAALEKKLRSRRPYSDAELGAHVAGIPF